VILVFEDSECDLNTISEDEDLFNAMIYAKSKKTDHLKCSLLDKNVYDKVRQEQMQSANNLSQTWQAIDVYRQPEQKEVIPEK
jgi:hypothetical protein